jgi:hypothetical protein
MSISELSFHAGLSKRNTRIFYYCILVITHLYMEFWSRSIFHTHFSYFKHLCFLTNISFYLNLIYYSYVLIMHVPYGNKFKNFKFLSAYFKFCYSISFVVFVLYWGFVITDPSLLLPDHKDRLAPFILDFFLHGMNFILNFIEHVYVFPKSDSKSVGYSFYIVFMICYGAFLQIIYHSQGVIVYPFVSKLSIIEFSVIVAIAIFLVSVGDATYRLLIKGEKHKEKIRKD